MRADRLIALLLLLQRRGRITAAEAAAELEISTRTARRDLEALAMSGVPVYSRHGRGGGWELIGGAQTDLTGLAADESRALFLAASGPVLTNNPALKSALRKLTSALPAPFQAEAEAATAAVKIDASGWGRIGGAPAGQGQPRHLETLADAVIRAKQVKLDYESPRSERRVRLIHPLGLVTKRNVWYLVAGVDGLDGGETRTYRVGRVRGVEILDAEAVRPPDFNLDKAWEKIVIDVAAKRSTVQVRVAVDPELVGPLRFAFGSSSVSIDDGTAGTAANPGWPIATIDAQSERSFAAQIAGFSDRVELLDAPPGVYESLQSLAETLHRLYACRH